MNFLPAEPGSVLEDASSQRIPARIIQTAKTGNLPLKCQASVKNLRLLNPSYQYCFYDDEQVEFFINHEFPEYREIYSHFPFPIQRYDFFRYLAIYRLGGFYSDTDVFLAKELRPLLSHPCVFPFEELTVNTYLRGHYQTDWEIGNYAFGAKAGHPFIKAVIENCVRSQKEPGWAGEMMQGIPFLFRNQFTVLNTTGPGLLTRTLCENPGLHSQIAILFPADVCNSKHWHQFGDYGVHLMNGSWRNRYGFLWERAARYWEVWKRHQLLKSSKALGPERRGQWSSIISDNA